jgi:hypothetical protein
MRHSQAELDAYHDIEDLEDDLEAMTEAARLSATASSRYVRALAKAHEARRARSLGRQQLAVVAGAELLALIDEYLAGGVPRKRPEDCQDLVIGLLEATESALDLPEVGLETVDALIDELERLLLALSFKPYAAWMKRARRYCCSGDHERMHELLRSILPHVNYTNGTRELLGCPACALDSIAWLMGPEIEPTLAYETLRPVLEHELRFPNEDPRYFARLQREGRVGDCSNVESCHMRYGRVLLYAGRADEAREYVMKRDPYEDAEVFLLPMIVRIEYALAANDELELEVWTAELESRMVSHEDIDEAFQAALRVAQALKRLGGEPARIAAALERAQDYARRLDARLGEPRYTTWLARERESGPPFMSAAMAPPRRAQ